MLNKYINTVVFIALTCSVCSGQKKSKPIADTIFVYETVIVYDTVYVSNPNKKTRGKEIAHISPKSISVLQIDSLTNQAYLLIISGQQSATIPISSIILSKNHKNLESMKNLSFLGVVYFAFQSMVLAQVEHGVTLGLGAQGVYGNKPIIQTAFSPSANLGYFINYNFKERWFLRTGFDYQFMMGNPAYKANAIDMCWDYEKGKPCSYGVGDGESASFYNLFALPISVGFQAGRFSPYLGAEFSYRISQRWLNKQIATWSIHSGVIYKISATKSVALSYSHSLNSDYEVVGHILDEPAGSNIISSDLYKWKSVRINLSYQITIPRKSNAEEQIPF